MATRTKEAYNAMLQAWAANITLIETTFGTTNAQEEEITNMAANYNYVYTFFQQFDGDVKAAYRYKNALEEGVKEGQPAPSYPTFEVFALPANAIFDIEGKADAYRRSFRNNLAYTDAIGAVLLIGDAAPKPPPPPDIFPALKSTPTGSYAVSTAFDKKGQAGVSLKYQIEGETETHNVPSPGISSPIVFTVTPPAGTQGKVVTIKLRGRYFDKSGAPVGGFSPEYTVYVEP